MAYRRQAGCLGVVRLERGQDRPMPRLRDRGPGFDQCVEMLWDQAEGALEHEQEPGSAGVEVDLTVELPVGGLHAIDIVRSDRLDQRILMFTETNEHPAIFCLPAAGAGRELTSQSCMHPVDVVDVLAGGADDPE